MLHRLKSFGRGIEVKYLKLKENQKYYELSLKFLIELDLGKVLDDEHNLFNVLLLKNDCKQETGSYVPFINKKKSEN